jgi:hypothetical protein
MCWLFSTVHFCFKPFVHCIHYFSQHRRNELIYALKLINYRFSSLSQCDTIHETLNPQYKKMQSNTDCNVNIQFHCSCCNITQIVSKFFQFVCLVCVFQIKEHNNENRKLRLRNSYHFSSIYMCMCVSVVSLSVSLSFTNQYKHNLRRCEMCCIVLHCVVLCCVVLLPFFHLFSREFVTFQNPKCLFNTTHNTRHNKWVNEWVSVRV